MIPVTFAGCFGWLHPGGGTRGVVLCPTFGHENMIAHRGWRRLAEQLAARGFSVLRFDYPGTGDSAGSETDPDRLAAWRASIAEAVRHLRETTGAGPVILVGLRLGATLALLAAEPIDGVDGVACLAPVLSGRRHVRELSLLAKTWRAINLLPETTQPADHLDVVGDRLTAQTLAELSGLDLSRFDFNGPWLGAGRVLLMQDGGPLADALAARLEARGCGVSRQGFPGAVDYLQDALSSRIPQAAFDAVVQWCEQLPAVSGPAADRHPVRRPTDRLPALALPAFLDLPAATEQPFAFGPSGGLFGILCRPSGGGRTGPTVIMPNTGFGRRIGDGRVFVTLARRLAVMGVSSLRMDLSGFGDSVVLQGGEPDPYAARNADNVVAAVAALDAAGHVDPVLVGICSGAYSAFHATLREPRVRAAILVNLQKFVWDADGSTNDSLRIKNRRQRRPLGFYLRAATRRSAWTRLAKGEVAIGVILMALCRRPVTGLFSRACNLLERVTGVQTRSGQIMRWFQALKSREVRISLLYSDGDPGLSELAHYFGRGRERFHGLPNVELALLSAADHALLEHDARSQFIEEVCRVVFETKAELSGGVKQAAPEPAGRPPDGSFASDGLGVKTIASRSR